MIAFNLRFYKIGHILFRYDFYIASGEHCSRHCYALTTQIFYVEIYGGIFMLISAVVTITLALVFYTIGVWSEKKQGELKKWHLIVFYLGLVFDTTGTVIMSQIASGGFKLDFHGVTGLLAIILMLFHALWATIVLTKSDEKAKSNFHKLSIVVWIIWLIPFVSGAIFGMVNQ